MKRATRKKLVRTTVAAVGIALLCGVPLGQSLEPERIKSKHGHTIIW